MNIAIITKGKMSELAYKFFSDLKIKNDFLGDKGLPKELVPENISFYNEEDNFQPTDEMIFISTGDMERRRRIFPKYSYTKYLNIIQSSNYPTYFGICNFVFPDVYFGDFTHLGDNNIISAGTIISHHCKIGSGNLLGPGCLLSGSVIIGNNCTIGSGVIFEPGVKIADNMTIPSGAIIVGNMDKPILAKREGFIFNGQYFISKR